MRPYGEKIGHYDRDIPHVGHKPGGSYDMSRTERIKIWRRLRKAERQNAQKESASWRYDSASDEDTL